MERSRLKNVIILILVLVNLFLLASLLIRKSAELSSRQLKNQQLVTLFAADNIQLDPSLISYQTPPSDKNLLRSSEHERDAAAFFLGSSLQHTDLGGNIDSYTGNNGVAVFRSTGSFDIVGTLSNTDDVQALCRQFCKEFSYTEPIFQLDESGTGTAVATGQFDGLSVFNSSVTFTFQNHQLTMVTGILLPEAYNELPSKTDLLSASAALTAFQRFRQENGSVVSSISALHLSYELQSTPTSAMTLVPSWCIITDTVCYYVNCSTGSIRVA